MSIPKEIEKVLSRLLPIEGELVVTHWEALCGLADGIIEPRTPVEEQFVAYTKGDKAATNVYEFLWTRVLLLNPAANRHQGHEKKEDSKPFKYTFLGNGIPDPFKRRAVLVPKDIG